MTRRNNWRRRGWVRESTHDTESYYLRPERGELRMVTTAHPGWWAAAGAHRRVRRFARLRHAMDYVERMGR